MKLIDLPVYSDFQLVPSMAVMGRTPVRVRDGRYAPIRSNGKVVGARDLASELIGRFHHLHYLDILGIRKGTVEWNLFQSITDAGGEVWADIGVVYADSLIDALMAGASYAVITTKTIGSLEEIASSFELTENLIMQMDIENGSVLSRDRKISKMDPGDLVKEIAELGIERFIVDDLTLGRERVPEDLIEKIVLELPENGSLYAGIERMDEIEALRELGAKGAIFSCSRVMEGAG